MGQTHVSDKMKRTKEPCRLSDGNETALTEWMYKVTDEPAAQLSTHQGTPQFPGRSRRVAAECYKRMPFKVMLSEK